MGDTHIHVNRDHPCSWELLLSRLFSAKVWNGIFECMYLLPLYDFAIGNTISKVILNFQEALKKIRLFSDRFWGGDYNIIKYIKIRCCQGERHPSQHWILNLHRCNLHVTYLKLHMHSFMNTFWTSQCVLSFTLHTQSCVWWHHACSNIRHE